MSLRYFSSILLLHPCPIYKFQLKCSPHTSEFPLPIGEGSRQVSFFFGSESAFFDDEHAIVGNTNLTTPALVGTTPAVGTAHLT